ncbi:ABC-type antimicrobial peptide transport system permease subunit [Arcicella aurantiaca]|uniref:ABC-type antimicrobial peptide transport system permease subunit n=1 Tax=Arcicella aurantiaca TaxID=591202 RepID=A0A316E908_9BACT|nr:FtsX-like permease family protein [Arcicella aurantiaca]PWK26148.1 ABC-type antimicrobial peptide transport system permease subunit [Arcicella aurantiaca]
MFSNYLKIAIRNLLKNKIYSLINVVGLSIGISACLVIYLIVSFEFSYENFQPERDRIYRVTSGFKGLDGNSNQNAGISAPIPSAIRKDISGIEKVVGFHSFWGSVIVPTNNQNKKILPKDESDIIICEPEYFDIFQYEWLQGNQKIALHSPNEVVLTDKKVEQYFGKIPLEQAIGRKLNYQDSLIVTVAGVVKSLPKNSDFAFNDFISFKSIEPKNWRKDFELDEWTNTNSSSQAFIKLTKGTNPNKIVAQFPTFLLKHLDQKDQWNHGRSLGLQALTDVHFNTKLQGNYGRVVHLPTLYILMGVAIFLLLIAIINFINLSTAQSINRIKEIGVRKVLGSSRKSLIQQFMIETFVITTVAVSLSIILVEPILWAYQDFIPPNLHFNILQPQIIAFLLLVLIITATFSGLYPAWIISAYNPISSIKNQLPNGQNRAVFLRKSLITFQFTFSQVFILGTIVVVAQSRFLLNKDMGFKKDAIVYFPTDWRADKEKKSVLIEKLKQIPAVEGISVGDAAARGGYSTQRIKYFNGKNEVELDPNRRSVDDNFIPLYGLKIIAGTNISKSDTSKDFVVNEAFVKAMGLKKPQDAIGKMLGYWDTKGNPMKFPIVGVVADFHFRSLHNAIQPLFIVSQPKEAVTINVKFRNAEANAKNMTAVLDKMKKAYNQVYPDNEVAFQPQFFDETIAKFYENEKKMAQLLNSATAIAILISCLGLFGLATFATAQRTKEIGIRKVLGASVKQIVGLLSQDFIKLVIIAIFIASPIAYYFMNEWLQDFAYRINIEWWFFALAGVIAIIIALLTVSYQAIKAAIANPVKSLRTE